MSANALRAGRATIEVSLITNRLNGQLSALGGMVANFGRRLASLGSLGASSGGLSGLFSLLVGSQAVRALAWPVLLAANLERTVAQFAALTGSAETARDIITDLEQFSKISLVDLSSLEHAAELLLGYGINAKNATTITRALAAAARGDSERMSRLALAIAQVNSANRLLGTEARQLAEAGLNILGLIAEKTGESIEKVRQRMAAGAVSANEVNEALVGAARAGGRFGKILKEMSNTFFGQLGKIRSGIRLLVRPLGQEVLPALVGYLKILNDAVAPATAMVKANASIATGIVAVVLSALAGMAALVGLGLGFQLLGFALAGVAGALGLAVSAVLTALTPLGALTALLIGGAGYLARYTQSGRTLAAMLVGELAAAAAIFGETWKGITAALAAGDLAAAGRVAMAALRLAWLEGTASLREIWTEFRYAIDQKTQEITFAVLRAFEEMAARLRKLWIETRDFGLDAFDVVVNYIAKTGESDAVKQQLDELLAAQVGARMGGRDADLQRLDRELKKKLAAIDQARSEAGGEHDSELVKQLDEQRKALEDARKAWEAAVAAAKKLPPIQTDFSSLPGALEAAAAAAAVGSLYEQRQGAFGGAGLGQRADSLNLSAAQRTADATEEAAGSLSHIENLLVNGGFAIV